MDPQNSSRSSNGKSRLAILQQFEDEINLTRRTAFEHLIRKYEGVQENSNSAVIDIKSMTAGKGRSKIKPKKFGNLSTYKGISSKAKKLFKELKDNLLDSSGYDHFMDDSQYLMNKLADRSSSISVIRACINISETSSVYSCDLETSMKESSDSNETLMDSYLQNDTTFNFDETPVNSPCRAVDTATLAEEYDQECPGICDLTYITRSESKGKRRITPIRVTNQRQPGKTREISKYKLVDSSNNDGNLNSVEWEPKKTAYQNRGQSNYLNCPRSGQLVSPNRISIEQDRLGKGVSPGMCDRFSAISIGLEMRNGNDKNTALWISETNQKKKNYDNKIHAISKFSRGHMINENKNLEIKFPEVLGNSHELEDNLPFEFLAKRTVERKTKTGWKCLSNKLPPSRKSTIFKSDHIENDICILSQLTAHKKKSSAALFPDNRKSICLISPQRGVSNGKCYDTELNRKVKSSFSAITSSNGSLMRSHSNSCSAESVNNSSREFSFLNPQCGTEEEKSNVNKLNETATNNETFDAAMSDDCSTFDPNINISKLKHRMSMELKIVCTSLSSEVINKFQDCTALANNTENKAEECSLNEHFDEFICNEELEPTSDITINAAAATRYYLRHSTIRRNAECLLNKNVNKNTSNQVMKYIAPKSSAVSSPKYMCKSSTPKKRLEYSPIAPKSSYCSVEKNNRNVSLVVSNSTSPHESDLYSPAICHKSLMRKLGNCNKSISSKVANQIDIVEEIGINNIRKKLSPLKHKQLVKYPSNSGSISNEIKFNNFSSKNCSDNYSRKRLAKSPEFRPGHSGFLSQPRNGNNQRKRKAGYEKVNSPSNKYFIQESSIHAISPDPCVAQENYNVFHESLPLEEKANEMSPSVFGHRSNVTPMRKIRNSKLSHMRSVRNSSSEMSYDDLMCSSSDVSANNPSPRLDVIPVRKIVKSKSNHARNRIASSTVCSLQIPNNDDISNDLVAHHLMESRVCKNSEVKMNNARKPFESITVCSEDVSDSEDFSNNLMGSCSTDFSTNIGNRHLIESPVCIISKPKSSCKKYSSKKSTNDKTSSSDDKKNSQPVHRSGSNRSEKILISKRLGNRETFNYQTTKAECNEAMKTSNSRKKLNFYSPKIFEGTFQTLSPKCSGLK